MKEISIALLSLRISRAICSPQHDMFSDKSNATQVTAKTVVLNTLGWVVDDRVLRQTANEIQ